MAKREDETRLLDEGRLLLCGRCGAVMAVQLPMPLDRYAKLGRLWGQLHQLCEPLAVAGKAGA